MTINLYKSNKNDVCATHNTHTHAYIYIYIHSQITGSNFITIKFDKVELR